MRVPNPYEHYPPGWLDYDRRAGIAFRIFSSAADVNRFGARYRLAKAFRGLHLDGYSDTTAKGYDALTRVTLSWSAFEALLKAMSKTRHDIPEVSSILRHDECLRDLRAADRDGRFLAFVQPRLDSARQKAEVERFLKGRECCGITLAQAVRHIFVHGPLTPSSNQAEPGAVVAVCDRLALALTRTMDEHFRLKLVELVKLAPDRPQDDSDIPF